MNCSIKSTGHSGRQFLKVKIHIKQQANMLIQQTLAAISAYTPSYLQTLNNASIKEQVNITRQKIKGYLAASNLILLETKELRAAKKAEAKEANKKKKAAEKEEQ
jgi:hypothetical protein